MSTVLKRRWKSDVGGTGLPRKDSRSCEYEAYVPDHLMGRRFFLEGEVAAEVADAEAAIVRLNIEANALVDTEALARILLRAEAVASSRIEDWRSEHDVCSMPRSFEERTRRQPTSRQPRPSTTSTPWYLRSKASIPVIP